MMRFIVLLHDDNEGSRVSAVMNVAEEVSDVAWVLRE